MCEEKKEAMPAKKDPPRSTVISEIGKAAREKKKTEK